MSTIPEYITEKLKHPPSEESLCLLPVFSGNSFDNLTPSMLNKSYHPDVSVSNIIFNNRAYSILKVANIKTIGDLLLTSYNDLLNYRNCGLQTVEVFQRELKSYILDKKFDYTPYWKDLESMLRNTVSIKERNFKILFLRLGVDQKSAYTLQKIGDSFNISREAVRQTLSHIYGIIVHPETEFKLRPFWTAIDRLIQKREIVISEEISKYLKQQFPWETKPEPYAVEGLLKIKKNKYQVTHNHLVGFSSSNCFCCPDFDDMLPRLMKDKDEILYLDVYEAFFKKFEECCPKIHTFKKQVVTYLVELQIYRNIKDHKQYKRKMDYIINVDNVSSLL